MFKPASSESSRSDFAGDGSARLADGANVTAADPDESSAMAAEAPPAIGGDMAGLASTPDAVRAASVRFAARNASDLICSPVQVSGLTLARRKDFGYLGSSSAG